MVKTVELRRHTAADGDVLTPDGVVAALKIGKQLQGGYEIAVSSGAQRATQTLACFLAGGGSMIAGGVVVDTRWRSDVEERWRSAYEATGSGDIEAFEKADPELVEKESILLAGALSDLFDQLPDGGKAIVVGHSPMHEVAIYGLTGKVIPPLSKGAGVLVTKSDRSYHVEPAG